MLEPVEQLASRISRTAKIVAAIVAIWIVLALFVGMVPVTIPAPPAWLSGWTALLALVVTTAVGARVLWEIPKVLREFLNIAAAENTQRTQ